MTAASRLAALPGQRLLAEFSLWSADLARLADDIARSEPHADLFHIDVADGRFAPAFLFFPDQVARIRALTARPLHVHLMVSADILADQAGQFAEAGADLVSVHAECGAAVPEALARLQDRGVAAGIVARLDTPVAAVAPFLHQVAFVTLLGTALGVKGQDLSPEAGPRLTQAAAMLRDAGRDGAVRLAADGGIRERTVPALRRAGAQTVVMGSLAFAAPDLAARMRWVHGLPA